MTDASTHPSKDKLSAFSLGQLPSDAAEHIEQHIVQCESCCETMLELSSGDTFVELLQIAKQIDEDATTPPNGTIGKTEVGIPQPLASHPRYEVDKLIGRGGMGRVFKARHRMMDRSVALKVIDREWVRKPDVINRFKREVKAAASLSHPNIVTAHDAEQADDLHFLVMEYVNGVDLSQTIRDRGPLPVEVACEYIRQAAEGLQFAHERGMVHRDIKPHNLMVTQDNVVKILDFGLASLAPQANPDEPINEDADGNLTIAGAIMGTPDYISPEQSRDASSVDGRSDIYSLGMTLYYLLAGRAPFSEGSATEKLRLHAEAEPTPLTSLRDDLPDRLLETISRMTAKQPEDRFESPAKVIEALLPFAEPVSAQSDNVTPELAATGGGDRVGWRALVSAAGLFGAITLGTIFYIVTNYGLVKVEVEDPALKVEFVGQEFTIQSKNPVKIRAGKHKLLIHHKGSEFTYHSDDFTIHRGSNPVIQVKLVNDTLSVVKGSESIQLRARPKENASSPTNAPAHDIQEMLTKWRGTHSNEVAQIALAISRAAGIPKEQWQAFGKDRSTLRSSIQGDPLSLVLLTTSAKDLVDEEFQVLELKSGQPRIAKPGELSGAMAISASRGYYSVLQPMYLTDLTYKAIATETDTIRLHGRAHFNGLGLFTAKINFKAEVTNENNVRVTEFTLPASGISVNKQSDGLWATKKIARSESDEFADDYDFSHVSANASEVFGFSPRRLSNHSFYGGLMDRFADAPASLSAVFDNRVEQVLWVKLPEAGSVINVLTVHAGTSAEFAAETFARDVLSASEKKLTWQELSRRGVIPFDASKSFRVIDKKTLLIGDAKSLEAYPASCNQPHDEHFLASAAPLNKTDHQAFALAKSMDKKYLMQITGESADAPLTSFVLDHLPIVADSNCFAITLALENEPKLELVSRYSDPGKQADISDALQRLSSSLSQLAGNIPSDQQRVEDDGMLRLTPVTKAVLASALDNAKVTNSSDIESRLSISVADAEPQMRRYIDVAVTRMTDRRRLHDAASKSNLRQIAMGFMLFESAHGYFPSVKTMVPNAKHPMSWRVAILPYIGEEELYRQYRLAEPWDSAHNKKLLRSTPRVYRHLSQTQEVGGTNYVVFAGPNTATGDGTKQIKFDDVATRDPATSTILVTESVATIRWTKPEDLVFNSTSLPKLRLIRKTGDFHAAMMDGSTHLIPSTTSESVLKAMITRNGGEVVRKKGQQFVLLQDRPQANAKKMTADEIVRRINKVHGPPTPKLISMISKAAGVPNGQWDSFSRSPHASTAEIKGEPLSLVLWKLNPAKEQIAKGAGVLEDFQYLGGVPKPLDLHHAMSVSRRLGYHSMLQPDYLDGLTFNIKSDELKMAKLTGNVRFHVDGLYSGKVHFVVDVDKNADMTVRQLSLPHYGIAVDRQADGTWKARTLPPNKSPAKKSGRPKNNTPENKTESAPASDKETQGKVGFFLLKKGKPIQGVTSTEGWQLNESGRGPLSYVHLKPVFEITKDKVQKCTLPHNANPEPKIMLTADARNELSRAMKTPQAKSAGWFVMIVNGKKLNGKYTTKYFADAPSEIVVLYYAGLDKLLGVQATPPEQNAVHSEQTKRTPQSAVRLTNSSNTQATATNKRLVRHGYAIEFVLPPHWEVGSYRSGNTAILDHFNLNYIDPQRPQKQNRNAWIDPLPSAYSKHDILLRSSRSFSDLHQRQLFDVVKTGETELDERVLKWFDLAAKANAKTLAKRERVYRVPYRDTVFELKYSAATQAHFDERLADFESFVRSIKIENAEKSNLK